MSRIFTLLFLCFMMSVTAMAKTPPEVLKPYKAYKTALNDGDTKAARKHAYEAWKKAEKILGDSKTTGDLAQNYAFIPINYKTTKKSKKRIEKAFKRSIALAHFHGDLEGDVEIQRRIASIRYDVKTLSVSYLGKMGLKPFKQIERALDTYGKRGTTYEGEMETLLARYYEYVDQHKTALKHIERAEYIFQNATDNIPSIYPILAKIFKGNNLLELNKPIEALLEYQEVMQNLEGVLPLEHPFITRAFGFWIKTRFDLENDGRLEEAEAAGLCECWPYVDYKKKALPLLRFPPVMPPTAIQSGHVNVIFDLNDDGTTTNIRLVNATRKVFVKSSLKSVEKWRFPPIPADGDKTGRTDIPSTINFRLAGIDGKLIPE